MLFSSWLRNWKRSLERRGSLRRTQRPRPPACRLERRLCLEVLEDRTLLSPVLTVTNLAVSGSNGAVVSNSGTFADPSAGASVTLTASAGTVVQNSNGTWSWSETTPAGAAQTAPVTIYATDSNGQTSATEFWLNVGQVFTVTNTLSSNNAGPGSFGWAINQVNNDTSDSAAQPDLIAFDITAASDAAAGGTGYNSSTGVATIFQGASPAITMPVVIDGYTQRGSSPNTLLGVQIPAPGSPPTTQSQGDNAVLKVQVELSNAGSSAWGIGLYANNSTIRGLVLNGIAVNSPAIRVEGTGDQIEGNFIGTDITGTRVVGNAAEGILIEGSNAVVGGTTPDARNIISGNGISAFYQDQNGILDLGTGNTVEGNFIGTDVSGKIALGNGGTEGLSGYGVADNGVNDTIGGLAPGAGNLISGNLTGIGGEFGNVEIQGNLIGTDITGTSALGNGVGISGGHGIIGGNTITNPGARNVISGNGIGIEDGSSFSPLIEGNYIGTDITGTRAVGNGTGVWLPGNAILGGADPGDGNVIAFNCAFGLRVTGSGNSILGNSIHDNNSGGIGLATGANDNQSAPELTAVTSSAAGTTISGTLTSVANTTFRIELFANQVLDASGSGEGQTFLGFVNATTDASGNATFTVSLSAGLPTGQPYLTATATNLSTGDTSAFSLAKAVPTVSVTDAGGTYNGGTFPATATVAGVNGAAGSSLEGVGLTLDYQQVDSQGNVLQDLGATAPSGAGTYKVTASFAGSTDYLAASNSVPFTIAKATPYFSLVTPPTVLDGTSNTQITGAIAAGSLIPSGSVTVAVNGVNLTATINADGTFAVTVPTASLGTGSYSIVYNYTGDNNFYAASGTATMDVTNGILALFDQSHAKHAGSAIPVQIELVSASGQDVSSASTTVTAVGMAKTTDTVDRVGSIDPSMVGALQPVQSADTGNPNNVFREQGGSKPFYMFNLQTPTGLTSGTYRLYFSVSGDPLWHWVTFSVG